METSASVDTQLPFFSLVLSLPQSLVTVPYMEGDQAPKRGAGDVTVCAIQKEISRSQLQLYGCRKPSFIYT